MGDVTEVVITTKLFRPSRRQHTVERTRLHDMLRLGCARPLTLVVAPTGSGKSTLVAEWLARDEITAGWVSLDGADNDPKRFWRYMLLAADRAGSAAGAAALRSLETAGSDVQMVSFSVDPENDRPPVLKQYAATNGADESRWHFLTGTRAQTWAISEGMNLAVGPDDGKQVFHSSHFLLIDAAGQVRGVYDSNDAGFMNKLVFDATHLHASN